VRLLVVRHAIAEDPAVFAATGRNDADRPLTDRGRRRMRRVVRGLKRLVPSLDAVASSPLLRAVETAEILIRGYRGTTMTRIPELAPSAEPTALVPWLERHRSRESVAAVGHEPALSRWVSWLLSGGDRPFVELKKGGVCCLDLPGSPGPASATLQWMLTPGQLRRMAR
jgi:phosphohistidine phosphatase